RLDESDDEIRFEVRDDGTGFDARRNADGRGIGNIRDRLAAIGGRVEIRSQPGQGTALSGLVPAKPATSLPGRPAASGTRNSPDQVKPAVCRLREGAASP